MKIYIKILFLTCICCYNVYGQTFKEDQAPATPNAANLGLYGSIPTNHFTGIPNITIPVYTLKSKDIVVPISLSYHVGELKLNNHPGWTGLGWTLASGGKITRKVNGAIDEAGAAGFGNGKIGYYYNKELLSVDNWSSLDRVSALTKARAGFSVVNGDIPEGVVGREVEADEFHFSFLGYSGTFYLDPNGEWRVKSDKKLKVIFEPNNGGFSNIYAFDENRINSAGSQNIEEPSRKFFYKFTIVDEKGFKYVFGGIMNSIEFSTPYRASNGEHSFSATTWNLTKIISPSNQEVTFNYAPGPPICSLGISYSQTIFTSGVGGYVYSAPQYGNGSLLFPVYPSSITTENGSIEFITSNTTELRYRNDEMADWKEGYPAYGQLQPHDQPDPAFSFKYIHGINDLKWKKLDNIVIKDQNSIPVRVFDFNYTHSTTERLKLLSFSESFEGQSKTYEFRYNPNRMPDYLDFKSDHWGFFNNNSVSSFTTDTFFDTKEPDPTGESYKAESLKKIIYPTGGETEFIYEQHKYRKVVLVKRDEGVKTLQENKKAGGLRIRKIIDRPNSSSPAIERNYLYVSGYKPGVDPLSLMSSGILNSESKYNLDLVGYEVDHNLGIFGSEVAEYTPKPIHHFTTNSNIPGAFGSGTHVGYSEVVEYITGTNGYTINTYTNYDKDFHGNSHYDEKTERNTGDQTTIYSPHTSKEEERGKITSMTNFYDNGKPASEEIFFYERSSNEFVRSMFMNNVSIENAAYLYGSAFKKYIYDYRLVKKLTNSYDRFGIKKLTTVNEYAYNSNKLISEEKFVNSKGETETTRYKYPFDRNDIRDLTFAEKSICAQMDNNHILSPVIFSENSLEGETIQKTLTPHQKIGDAFYPKITKTKKGGNTQNSYQEQLIFKEFYNNGKVKEIVTRDGTSISYIWGYNGEYLIAKVQNATAIDIEPFITILEGSSLDDDDRTIGSLGNEGLLRGYLNNLRTELPDSFVTTYTYDPLIGVTSITDPKGYTIYYNYDSLNRLTYVNDHDGNVVNEFEYHFKD